jgi:dolichol kinase
MSFPIITIPVVIFFVCNGIAHLYYGIRLHKLYPNMHNLYNTIFTVGLWVVAGLIYPIYFDTQQDFLWFLALSVFLICIFTPFIITIILMFQYFYVLGNNPRLREKRSVEKYIDNCRTRLNGSQENKRKMLLKIDIKRKALHLFPAIVIISIWVFFVKIWDGMLDRDLIWGIDGYQYATFLIITAGYSGILVFAALDYLRLSYIFNNHNYFYLIPDNVLDLLSKSMKKRELYEFTKPVALVLTFAPLYFLPFGIFSAIALISTIGDGAASLFGLKFGKKGLSKNSNKTISGYIAGFIISFLVGFISFLLFLPSIKLLKMIIMALMGAGMFLLIDLIPINVDDNILNPLFSALGIMIVYTFL